MLDTLPRSIGYLEGDFLAGSDITAFIFDETKKRKPGWNANALYHLDLVADKPLSLSIDGWDWHTNGTLKLSYTIINKIITNEDITGLKMAFRYDD